MYVFNHQIAGMHFRTEMDIWIPWLDDNHFRAFVEDGVGSDLFLRLACIRPGSLTQPSIDHQVIAGLSYCAGFNQKTIDSPLLQPEVVRSCLRAVNGHPEQAGLEIKQSSVVIFDFYRRELDIFFACREDDDYSGSRLGSNLFAPFLVAFDAVMVHSAGLICGDCVAVFMAPDEGGKTTVVSQADAKCCGILSDDQIILWQTDGVLMAHGKPWGRFTDGPKSARLGSLFLLESWTFRVNPPQSGGVTGIPVE